MIIQDAHFTNWCCLQHGMGHRLVPDGKVFFKAEADKFYSYSNVEVSGKRSKIWENIKVLRKIKY